MPWLCRPTGRTRIGELARGSWCATVGSAAAAVRELSGSSEKWAVLQHPPFLPFPAELRWQSIELSINRKKDFFPGCIRKQSDLAVLVIFLQLSWLRCTSQELTSFLSIFQSFFIGAVNNTEAILPQFTAVGWESATELSPSYVANFKYLLHKIING